MGEVIVIGAGITGLVCAWALKRLGIEVRLLEGSSRAGGAIRTHVTAGYCVESGPNTILPTAEASRMIKQIGLETEVVTTDARLPRFVYVRGRLRKVPFAALSVPGMLRALMEPLVRSQAPRGESVADFFRRRVGNEAHDRLVAPFVAGIYAGNSERLSLAATFPRLLELERQHRSILIGALRSRGDQSRQSLTTFAGGMETLPRRLSAGLPIEFHASDISVTSDLRVRWNSGETRACAVVVTAPAYAAARIFATLSPELARLLAKVVYAPIVVAACSLPTSDTDAPPRGLGFLIPPSEQRCLLGTLFSSTLFPGRAPKGRVLLTSFMGGTLAPEVVHWTDDVLWRTATSKLREILRLRRTPDPVALFRYERAIPQYGLGHPDWLGTLRSNLERLPGLFITGNYLEGVSVPSCMEAGRKTADTVADHLRRTT